MRITLTSSLGKGLLTASQAAPAAIHFHQAFFILLMPILLFDIAEDGDFFFFLRQAGVTDQLDDSSMMSHKPRDLPHLASLRIDQCHHLYIFQILPHNW